MTTGPREPRRIRCAVAQAALVVACAVLTASCGASDAGSPPSAEPSDGASSGTETPTGGQIVVTPVNDIEGAKRFESDGVSVLVPDGWETDRRESDEYVQIDVFDPADRRNPVTVTVQEGTGDESAVDMSSEVTATQLGASGATDVRENPASWEGWDYATAITGAFDQGEGGENVDFLAVTVLSGSGTVIGVTAQAPEGTFDDSLASQVQSSLKDQS